MRDAPTPAPPRPDDGPEALSPALAARLRGLSVPDPGPAYWASLPGRVTARTAGQGTPASAARPATHRARALPARTSDDRAPARRASPRRLTPTRIAVASLSLVVLALSTLWGVRVAPWSSAPTDRIAAVPGEGPSDALLGDDARQNARGHEEPVGRVSGDTLRPAGPGTASSVPPTPRASFRRPGAAAPEAPLRPVPTQHIAAAGADVRADAAADAETARRAARALADSADAEGVRLLRRAQLVALALQNATRTDDVSVLAPLAAGLASGLAQWRAVPGVDPALVASADVLEPIVVGLGLLAPADTSGARQLRDAARRADLSLQLDRALIAAGRPLSPAY